MSLPDAEPLASQASTDIDRLLFSGVDANAGIDGLLAPDPDAFEREIDNLGLNGSGFANPFHSFVVPDHDAPHSGYTLAPVADSEVNSPFRHEPQPADLSSVNQPGSGSQEIFDQQMKRLRERFRSRPDVGAPSLLSSADDLRVEARDGHLYDSAKPRLPIRRNAAVLDLKDWYGGGDTEASPTPFREAFQNQRKPIPTEPSGHPVTQLRTSSMPAPRSPGNQPQGVLALGEQSMLSLAQVVAEITPVPFIGPLVDSLRSIFEAVEHARINKAQWKLLQARCVMVARMAGIQVTNLGDHLGFAKPAATLEKAFEEISAQARRYNEMEQTTAFFQFEEMSEEIKRLFGTLDPCLTQFSFTMEIAQSQWIDEFRIVQEQELTTLRSIREKILDVNKDPKHDKFDQTKVSGRRAESLRSKGMSAQEMFECLIRHGCQDLSDRIDMRTILPHAVATGAYGDIFKGTLYDNTDIAIKVWSFRRAEEAPYKCLKGAMRELYNWSKADHENIQKLLGVVMFKDRLGMVSKWMSNGNLRDYIEQHKPEDRYQLCMQAAKAVRYLHKERMVHGDLKACNFLVSSDGTVKLTDFDHSIISCYSIMFSQTTTMGGGTMRWMAPELVMDEGEVELRSTQADVYALGMTMLEIITGAVPYVECQSDNQVFYKLSDKVPPERKEQFQDARGDRMWELLVQCWDHDPALRPSADKVVDSLQSLTPVTILTNDSV